MPACGAAGDARNGVVKACSTPHRWPRRADAPVWNPIGIYAWHRSRGAKSVPERAVSLLLRPGVCLYASPCSSGQNRQGDHHMIRAFFAVAAIALGVGVALAQQDPIAARRALMKANGDEAKAGAAMAKGEAPFDLAKARKMFSTFEDAAAKAPSLFPDNSKTGGDTAAKPEIWENIEDFKARLVKLGTDSKAALDSVTDLATFKAGFGNIG